MIAFRILSIYLGVGAAWQLGARWYGSRKYGAYAMNVAIRAMLGPRAAFHILLAVALWPISISVVLFQSRSAFKQRHAREIARWVAEMAGKCPDCGGPLEAHTHEEPPIN